MDNLITQKISLKEGEEIVRIVRHYVLTLWPKILAVFLLVTLPFFFIFPLFKKGYWGVVLFLFLIFSGIFYGLRELVVWYFNVFIITNKRIIDIDQRGIFERVVSEAPYEKIQDVSYRIKGIFQTLLRYGSVHIQTAGATMVIEIRNVKNPEKIQELIIDLSHFKSRNLEAISSFFHDREKMRKNFDFTETAANEEELKIIKKSIENLNEEQLEELGVMVHNKLRQIKLKRLDEITNHK